MNYSDFDFSPLIPKLVMHLLESDTELMIKISYILCNLAAETEKEVNILISCDYIHHCNDLILTANNKLRENLI